MSVSLLHGKVQGISQKEETVVGGFKGVKLKVKDHSFKVVYMGLVVGIDLRGELLKRKRRKGTWELFVQNERQ